jgi:hypothetical protein
MVRQRRVHEPPDDSIHRLPTRPGMRPLPTDQVGESGIRRSIRRRVPLRPEIHRLQIPGARPTTPSLLTPGGNRRDRCRSPS